MRFYKSKIGEIRSEESWKYELETFWKVSTGVDAEGKFPKPLDHWDRFVRILGLEEIENEDQSNSDDSSSDRWVGVF